MTGDCKLSVTFSKGKVIHENGLYFIEALKDKNYTNSLLTTKNEFLQYYNLFKSLKYDTKTFGDQFELISFKINNTQTILKFDSEDDTKKYIEFDLRKLLDKIVRIDIKLTNQNKESVLFQLQEIQLCRMST